MAPILSQGAGDVVAEAGNAGVDTILTWLAEDALRTNVAALCSTVNTANTSSAMLVTLSTIADLTPGHVANQDALVIPAVAIGSSRPFQLTANNLVFH